MNKRKTSSAIVTFSLLVGILAVAVPTAAAQELMAREQVLEHGFDSEGPVTNMNPYASGGSGFKSPGIYETLAYRTTIYPGGVHGLLAENWWFKDDYTFIVELRPEATFWDGTSVTAEDVVFSMRTQGNPKYGGIYLSRLEIAESVEIVDKRTIQINIDKKHPPRTKKVYMMMLSPLSVVPKSRWARLLEEYGENIIAVTPNLNNPEDINGSGPYRYIHSDDSKTVFERVENWWGEKIGWHFAPKYYREYYYGSDATMMTQGFVGGQCDQGDGPYDPKWIREHSPPERAWVPGGGADELIPYERAGFPMVPNMYETPITRHRWLREAMTYASDKKHMLDASSGGMGVPSTPCYLHPALSWLGMEEYLNLEVVRETFDTKTNARGLPYVPYDPDKAISILEDHCEGSPEEGWWYPNKEEGKKIGPWTVTVWNGATDIMAMLRVLANNWSGIGIETKTDFTTYGVYSDRSRKWVDFDWRWGLPMHYTAVAPAAHSFERQFATPAKGLWAGSVIPYREWWSENFPTTENTADEVEKLINELWSLPKGSDESIRVAREIQEIVVPQIPMISIFHRASPTQVLTHRWVNFSYIEDRAETCRRQGHPWYLMARKVYPKSVELESFTLTPGSVETGEETTARVTLKNTGKTNHEYNIKIRNGPAKPDIGPEVIANKIATIPAGESKTISISFSFDEPGSYTLTVDDWRVDELDPGDPIEKTLIVEEAGKPMISLSTLNLSKAVVEPGESTTVSVDVSNEGDAEGSETIEITLDGETIKSETVTLEPGETTTVSATTSKSTEGTYTVKAGELTRTFTVEKREIVIPPGLEDKVTLAIRMAENARSAAVSAGSSAQAAKSAANEAKETAQEAVTAAQSAKTSADEAKDLASEAKDAAVDAKTAAQEAKTAAEEVEGGASTSMVIASMIVTIIVVLAGVYAITGKRAT